MLVGFPLALLSDVVVVVGLCTSLGLSITLLGIPLAVLTLQAARGFAVVERARLQLRNRTPLPAGAETSVSLALAPRLSGQPGRGRATPSERVRGTDSLVSIRGPGMAAPPITSSGAQEVTPRTTT